MPSARALRQPALLRADAVDAAGALAAVRRLGGGLGCCGLGGSGLARADGLFRGRLCLVTRGRCLAALRLGVILRAGCRRARCLAFGCWSIGLHARSFSYHVRTALAHLPVPPSHCVTNVSACLSQVLPYAHLLQIPLSHRERGRSFGKRLPRRAVGRQGRSQSPCPFVPIVRNASPSRARRASPDARRSIHQRFLT